MNFEKDNRLNLNINSIILLIFGLLIGVKIGAGHTLNILAAVLSGIISGFVIGLGIITFSGIGIIIGFKIAMLFFDGSYRNIIKPPALYPRKITDFLISPKDKKEIFEPIFADWQEEFFEALFRKEIWKARWINIRYTYAFIKAMWMKSSIANLIEFVIKIAKQ